MNQACPSNLGTSSTLLLRRTRSQADAAPTVMERRGIGCRERYGRSCQKTVGRVDVMDILEVRQEQVDVRKRLLAE